MTKFNSCLLMVHVRILRTNSNQVFLEYSEKGMSNFVIGNRYDQGHSKRLIIRLTNKPNLSNTLMLSGAIVKSGVQKFKRLAVVAPSPQFV